MKSGAFPRDPPRTASLRGYFLSRENNWWTPAVVVDFPKRFVDIGRTQQGNGRADAATNRDLIAAEMTPAALEEAQRRARVCLESQYKDCD